MKKRSIIKIFLCLVIVLGLTGCFSKDVITPDTFKTQMESKSLIVTDKTQNYDDELLKSYLYAEGNGYYIEFYVVDSIETAKEIYNENHEELEQSIDGNYSKSETNVGNYQTYGLTNKGKYTYISRVENTIIFSEVDEEYKENIKELVKELGY